MMEQTILLVVQVVASIGLIGLVLLQQGKGADAGASFGGGASQTVFGSSGSGNFLTKLTATLAAIFFIASLGLAYYARQTGPAADSIDFSPVLETINGDLPSLVPSKVDSSEPAAAGDLPPLGVNEVASDTPADTAVVEGVDKALGENVVSKAVSVVETGVAEGVEKTQKIMKSTAQSLNEPVESAGEEVRITTDKLKENMAD